MFFCSILISLLGEEGGVEGRAGNVGPAYDSRYEDANAERGQCCRLAQIVIAAPSQRAPMQSTLPYSHGQRL